VNENGRLRSGSDGGRSDVRHYANDLDLARHPGVAHDQAAVDGSAFGLFLAG
jgi:hypothetical protein